VPDHDEKRKSDDTLSNEALRAELLKLKERLASLRERVATLEQKKGGESTSGRN
jgi:hypothetical protein